jgi:hypothetical protein
MCYYFYQILLLVNIERRRSQVKLIGQNSYCPEIYLLVVFLPLKQLRREVERRPTEGRSEFLLLIDSPSEIA